MPLLDHFHPPVSERRSWEGFHGLWAAALDDLGNLPGNLELAHHNGVRGRDGWGVSG